MAHYGTKFCREQQLLGIGLDQCVEDSLEQMFGVVESTNLICRTVL